MGDDRKQNEMEGALLFDDEDEGGDERGARDGDAGHPGDGRAEEAMEFLSGVLRRMGLDARVTVREDAARVVLDVSGEDAGRAIGKKGMTLDALQFLANKVVNRFPERRRYIIVDSGDYRERHEQGLVSLAKREAKRALDTGRIVTLEPMSARDRRLIHLSLSKLVGVSTKSNGEGLGRRVQIIPARQAAGGNGAGGGGRRGERRRGGGGRSEGGRGGPGPSGGAPRRDDES
ncbi:MAG: protein jag [Deltaproteobacteria bacterium]